MSQQIAFLTVLLTRKVFLVIQFEATTLPIQNPRMPTILVLDSFSVTYEHANVECEVPVEAMQRGGALASDHTDNYVHVLEQYARAVRAAGSFQPTGRRFVVDMDALGGAVDPPGTPPAADLRRFVFELERTLGAQEFQPEGAAFATGHSIPVIRIELEALLSDQTVHKSVSGEAYQRVGAHPGVSVLQDRPAASEKLGLPLRLIRVMVGGPGDTGPEREAAREVIEAWHTRNAEATGVALVYKHWSKDTYPTLSGRPQGLVNEQLLDRADVLVALFWNRLGMDTGLEQSGTVEEIGRARALGKHVMLYFSTRPGDQSLLGDDKAIAEFRRVAAYRREVEDSRIGMFASFVSIEEFKRVLEGHLDQLLRDVRAKDFEGLPIAPGARPAGSRGPLEANARVAQRALRALHLNWQSDQHAKRTGKEQQQHLNQLSKLLLAHLVEWNPYLRSEAATQFQQVANEARRLGSESLSYGTAELLERRGDAVFFQATTLVDLVATEA